MKNLTHILFLTREYNHPLLGKVGGTGVFYKNLSDELNNRGIKISVFGVGKKKIEFNDNGVNIFFIKDFFRKNIFLEFFRSISSKLCFLERFNKYLYRKEKQYITHQLKIYIGTKYVDIIETHDFDGISMYLNTINTPYVIRSHGSWSVLEKYFGYKNVPIGKKYCERKAFDKAKNIIAVSKYNQKLLKELFEVNNSKLIYNGINYQVFNGTNIRNHQSLGFIGNLSSEKGIDIAIDAYKKLRDNNKNVTLHIAGRTTSFFQKIHNDLDEKYKKGIFLYGQLPVKDLLNLYDNINICLFPSKGETSGLAIMEAMAMKKSVISSNICAFREIIDSGENAYIVDKLSDYVDYAENIFDNEELLKHLGERARNTIINKFSSEKMIEDTLNYYQDVINNEK